MPEPIAESQLRLYPILWWRTPPARLIRKWVGYCTGRRRFWCRTLIPNASQILGEGIGFLPDYMVREAMAENRLITRQIHNPRQIQECCWRPSMRPVDR
ncbi:hypothetical protein DMH17_06000 [Raoultella planticola]|nr:hypothetical protein [Raoultella planticola]